MIAKATSVPEAEVGTARMINFDLGLLVEMWVTFVPSERTKKVCCSYHGSAMEAEMFGAMVSQMFSCWVRSSSTILMPAGAKVVFAVTRMAWLERVVGTGVESSIMISLLILLHLGRM